METFKTWQRPPLGVKNVVSEKTQVRTVVQLGEYLSEVL